MKPEIRKIVTRSALFFGILTVSAAGMKLAAWRNAQNAPDALTASAAQSPVIVLDAGHGEDNARGTLPQENAGAFRFALIDFFSLLCYNPVITSEVILKCQSKTILIFTQIVLLS